MNATASAGGLDTVWLTRCPVPTASGIAYRQGWLAEEFGREGVAVAELRDAGPQSAGRHLDHGLPGLFREGGSIPALTARAAGAPTRLIGLTWIEERQVILVRPDSGITGAAALAGRRAALPVHGPEPGAGVMRAMALHGFRGALGLAGLGLDAVDFVEVPDARDREPGWTVNGPLTRPWTGIEALARGEVDAVYAKGPAALDHAVLAGAVIGVDLDDHPDPACRVNNGTPRPITVHERTLAEHPWAVALFLAQTLRAATWAADHRDDVLRLLAVESGGSAQAAARAHRGDFHRRLRPDLSETRLQLLDRQKEFLVSHGFVPRDFPLADWIAPQPLRAAEALAAAR
ncbi:ABC transporter substrate-binding protein [Actinacidiphila paucisporea]|uniref:2'-hydroxybiphenyl-2-sulfinate desulfinase n=1 Tax=Actinacidiphila paucisporea TaxID=310782 RepID=A0A1M7QEB4_9ACTN|nr:ABC transporter substrate-binding protein [Actinacidiphila paucisporea]SHN29282.1 2'-hydroxybiphenyl-2-sulfinate desulfinase [Actinacidiphila paucisporea]